MRRMVPLAVLVVVLAPSAALGVTERTPSLKLLDRAPLTIAGAGFTSREVVQVTATTDDGTVTRSLRANASGAFTMRFLALSAGRCEALRVVARGPSGPRAFLKLFPPAACQPLSDPA